MVFLRCSTCRVKKPHDKFSPDKAKRAGRASQCKVCRRKLNKRWYAKYKELKLCVACGKTRGAGSGATLCNDCLFEQRERMRDRRWNVLSQSKKGRQA